MLIHELKRIHQQGWIESKRLNSDGTIKKYTAQNGGGYTLEAELGITPNGYAEPDFLGWEVKQFAVDKCTLINSKALTLMTPEPDGGYYGENGIVAFVRKYGYKNQTTPDRLDFTGRHMANKICDRSGLLLVINGYDMSARELNEAGGCIALVDSAGNVASSWSFTKLMALWKRKHAKAVYIPSLSRMKGFKSKYYSFCSNVRLFEGTTFERFLHGMAETCVYYDPGINIKNINTKPKAKPRSQFRIRSGALNHLYEKQTVVDVLQY